MNPLSSLTALLDKLLVVWSDLERFDHYYLDQVLPELLSDPRSGRPVEAQVLQELHQELTPYEWRNLAELLTARAAKRSISSQKIRDWNARQIQSERHLQDWERQQDAERYRLIRRMWNLMECDFLALDAFYEADCAKLLPRARFERHKRAFVRRWIRGRIPRDSIGERLVVSDEQADAIAAVHGNIQVVARAGAGKTDTLVNRAIFLHEHCHIPTTSMMLLVFNDKPAKEIEDRLKLRLGEIVPHVMTFHALAKRLVDPPCILADNQTRGTKEHSRFIQTIIDSLLQQEPFAADVRELMLTHFSHDWELTQGELSIADRRMYLDHLRSVRLQTLQGEYVKSSYEKCIANFLVEHGIDYKYEWPHQWNGRNYKPDFTIFRKFSSENPKREILIEFFGIENDPKYLAQAKEKRAHWETQDGVRFFSYAPEDIRKHGGILGFLAKLEADLKPVHVPFRLLTQDELWAKVEKHAVKQYHKTIGDFLNRCRQQAISPDQLQRLVRDHEPFVLTLAEAMFLRVASTVYEEYVKRLKASKCDDFNGVLARAASQVSDDNRTAFFSDGRGGDLKDIRYFFIDEYQDFSEQFDQLVTAIRSRNPNAEFFCVGDDWQAINGFAGANLRYFHGFQNRFDRAQRLEMLTNYRSTDVIVEAGNTLMARHGRGAVAHRPQPGTVYLCDLDCFRPNPVEAELCSYNRLLPAVLRIVNYVVSRGSRSITLLSRMQVHVPDYIPICSVKMKESDQLSKLLEDVRCFFPELNKTELIASTVHSFKGKQSQTVIVLDAVAGSFPSIHPNWVFTRLFGDSLTSIVEEEERLFYVALTRAKDDLFLITDGTAKSPFLNGVKATEISSAVAWQKFSPPKGPRGWLVIRVQSGTRMAGRLPWDIEVSLKADSFKSDESRTSPWVKPVRAADFSIRSLQHQPWSTEAHRLEVAIASIDGTVQEMYRVETGRWERIDAAAMNVSAQQKN